MHGSRIGVGFLALQLAAAWLAPASAEALTVFTDQAAFLAAATIESTEDFDGFASGGLGSDTVVIDEIVYVTDSGSWNILANGVSAPNGLIGSLIDDRSLAFGPGLETNAIGFHLKTIAGSSLDIVVDLVGGGSSTFPLALPFPSTEYRGFVAEEGIIGIRLQNTGSGNYVIDDVSRAAIVPEPASALLLALGLAGLGAGRRRGA
jgi:hypothetical protein